MALSKAS